MPTKLTDVPIDAILRRQFGVISRAQALAAGLSADQIDSRVAAGRWLPVYRGVYLAADRELGDEARVIAAGLRAGGNGTVSGVAAAWWHGLWPDPPATTELTVPARSGPRPGHGVRVRRRDLDNVDRVATRGLWVTAVPLTVLEAAVALGEHGSQLVDRALQRRVSFDALFRAHRRNLGRRGSAAAGRLLTTAADRAASEAERRAMSLLREAGLDGWRRHFHIGEYQVDLAFPENRVAIEIDGWAWHHDTETFRRDRQRQNALVLAGWRILRFTWHDLTARPGAVVAEIRAALTARRVA